ncbi:MAG: hypothetical protein PHY33_06380, partial [Methanobacteriaceae archaeon]|nr:hypothetical protein [Methanobacteriaceae archaeon]
MKLLKETIQKKNLKLLEKAIQWVVWRYENRDGETKPAKVPYNPNVAHKKRDNNSNDESNTVKPEYTGAAMINNPDTWGSYESARMAMETTDIFDGIGIVLYNNLCGIDIDNCSENGELTVLSKGIIDIMDSYAEYSPSGYGIHILFYADIDDDPNFYIKNSLIGVEIYNRNRFFTYIGRGINDKE